MPLSAARPLLLLPLRNRAAFRQASFEGGEAGLFVPGEADIALGDEVELELHFLAEDVRFRIRAQVKWKRPTGRRSAPPGFGLTYLASEDAARKHLQDFVDGKSTAHTERDARRLPIHVEAKVDVDGAVAICQTDDISTGGCFLLVDANKRPAMGSRVTVKLKSPRAFFPWMTLPAVVCWHRDSGDRRGFGVRFVFADDSGKRRVERLVTVLKERVSREVHVQPSKPPTTLPPSSQPPTPASSSMLPRK